MVVGKILFFLFRCYLSFAQSNPQVPLNKFNVRDLKSYYCQSPTRMGDSFDCSLENFEAKLISKRARYLMGDLKNSSSSLNIHISALPSQC